MFLQFAVHVISLFRLCVQLASKMMFAFVEKLTSQLCAVIPKQDAETLCTQSIISFLKYVISCFDRSEHQFAGQLSIQWGKTIMLLYLIWNKPTITTTATHNTRNKHLT